jgi:nucleoid DNA-binding protein
MPKRYTKTELVEDLLLQDLFASTTKKAVTELIEDIFISITEQVAQGSEVSIPGFGKFIVKELKSGKRVPKFVAFKDFKDAIPQN